MKKPASIKDVANAASVSITAVSRHVNGLIDLPAETRKRIDDAIERLGYRANPHARRLSTGRSDTLGLVVPDISNLFFARLAAFIEEEADKAGFGLVLCATLNRPARELEYISRLNRNHVDALLFATNHLDDGTLAAVINENPRVVLLDEDIPGAGCSKVFSQNEQGGYLAAARLIQAGHRHLAVVGGPAGLMSAEERLAGFRRAVAESGGACRIVAEIAGDYGAEHGARAARQLLAERTSATAVFTGNDEICLGLLEVLRRENVAIGTDLSIVTFDDIGTLRLFEPAISAVRQDLKAMSMLAIRVAAAIARTETTTIVEERVPVTLVERASVSPPRKRARLG